jgi:hypothetical protein
MNNIAKSALCLLLIVLTASLGHPQQPKPTTQRMTPAEYQLFMHDLDRDAGRWEREAGQKCYEIRNVRREACDLIAKSIADLRTSSAPREESLLLDIWLYDGLVIAQSNLDLLSDQARMATSQADLEASEQPGNTWKLASAFQNEKAVAVFVLGLQKEIQAYRFRLLSHVLATAHSIETQLKRCTK